MKKLSIISALITTALAASVCNSSNGSVACCETSSQVFYTDADGEWGVENGDWCLFKENDCPAKVEGYKCCKVESKVYYNDEFGDWSVENGDWCNIVPAVKPIETTTSVEPVETTTTLEPVETTTTLEPVETTLEPVETTLEPVETTTVEPVETTTTVEPVETTTVDVPTTSPEYCWAEAYGYPCCKETTIVWSHDSQGTWGYENDSWCGIEDLYEENKDDCWASILDAPCCEGNKVLATDEYGTWGYEFGKWCGITKAEMTDPTLDETKNCWSVALGFPCCYGNRVVETDENGSWGYENNKWCGIPIPAEIEPEYVNVFKNGKLNENFGDNSWDCTVSVGENYEGKFKIQYGAVSIYDTTAKLNKNGSVRFTVKGTANAKFKVQVSDIETDTFSSLEDIVLTESFVTYVADVIHDGFDRISFQLFSEAPADIIIKDIIISNVSADKFDIGEPKYTTIYTNGNEFPSGYQNWSWETEVTYDKCIIATINAGSWGAFSIKTESALKNGSIRFDMKTNTEGANVNFAVSSSTTEEWVSVKTIKSSSEWTTYTIDIACESFDRLNFQDGTNNGIEVSLRNIIYSTGTADEFEAPKEEDNGPKFIKIYGTESAFPAVVDNWSWETKFAYDEAIVATISGGSKGAVSFKTREYFSKGAIKFDMKTDVDGTIVNFIVTDTDVDEWSTIEAIPSTTEWTTYTLDITSEKYDRLFFQDESNNGIVLYLRNIVYCDGTSADFTTETPTATTTVGPTVGPTATPVYTTIYTTEAEFPAGFQNWGWDTEVTFEDDSMIATVAAGGWGALSMKSATTYSNGSIRFDMKTDIEGANVNFAVADSVADEWISVETIPSTTEWKTYTIDIVAEVFDRINFQDGTNEGIAISLRNIIYSTGSAAEFDSEENPTTTVVDVPTTTEVVVPTTAAPVYTTIYTTEAEFPAGFQNWGWDTEVTYEDDSMVVAVGAAWGALSFKNVASTFTNGSIRFDMKSSAGGNVNLAVSSSVDDAWISVETIPSTTEWKTYTIDIVAEAFDRINFQDGTGEGITFSLRNIIYSTGSAAEFDSEEKPVTTAVDVPTTTELEVPTTTEVEVPTTAAPVYTTIYTTEAEFPAGFQNWGWDTEITYEDDSMVVAVGAAWGALSFKNVASTFTNGSIRFDMKSSAGGNVNLAVSSSVDDAWISVETIPSTTEWKTYTIDIVAEAFDRINFQDGTGEGITFSLRNIIYSTGSAAEFDSEEKPTTTAVDVPTTTEAEVPTTAAPVYTTIYTTEAEFPAGFQNWGWDTEVTFEDDSMIATVAAGGWGALSMKSATTYSNGSIRFDMKTDIEGANVNFAVADSVADEWISVETIPSTTEWKTYTIDIVAEVFDRINFQDGTNEGIAISLRNIIYSTGSAAEFDSEEKPTTTVADVPTTTAVVVPTTPAKECKAADLEIYSTGTAFPAGWENWGWGIESIEYDEDGNMNLQISSYGAVSFKQAVQDVVLCGGSLHFEILSDTEKVSVSLDNVKTEANSALGLVTKDAKKAFKVGEWSEVAYDIEAGFEFDRINIQELTGEISNISIRNLKVSSGPAVPPVEIPTNPKGEIVAKALGGRSILLLDVNVKAPVVKINDEVVEVTSVSFVETPRAITYIELAKGFSSGDVITGSLEDWSFETSISSEVLKGTIATESTKVISEFIYGSNWVDDKADLGASINRFGGNRISVYNPYGDFDGSASDWYYENGQMSGSATEFIKNNNDKNRGSFLSIPALDWVAKNESCYAYPKWDYPNQKAFDPYNKVAGNGQDLDGNLIEADPSRCNVPWNTTMASKWLSTLNSEGLIPNVVAIDNEMEIAHHTHHDVHPETVGYDEVLQRFTDYSNVVRDVFDDKVEIAGPSTCNWYFWWNSALPGDKENHDNIDFLPWFLKSMAEYDNKNGRRLLDILDIHNYLDSGNDCESVLKQTRTWWDPTHRNDQKYGVEIEYPMNTQPNPEFEAVIPRIQKLIDEYYPGTKLWFGEYSMGAREEMCSGLAMADIFGIFGREGLYGATYWSNPEKDSFLSMAYWLYRNGDKGTQRFGNKMIPFEVPGYNPDVFGAYAAEDEDGKLTVVIINKDLKNDIAVSAENLKAGEYTIRYFGNFAGENKLSTVINIGEGDVIAIPAYTAIFLGQN